MPGMSAVNMVNTVNQVLNERYPRQIQTAVLPESGGGMEHMASFDYGYQMDAVRDWLFLQHK